MTSGIPCYCINPRCPDRQNQFGFQQKDCFACGTPLVIQPHNLLLREPIYGFGEDTNSEIFTVESLNFTGADYPQLIKILRPNAGAIAERLFQQEGEILSQLRGYAVPNVEPQPYFQVAFTHSHTKRRKESLHCLVMEHIQGQSLDNLLQQSGKLPTAQVIDWLRQLAQLLLTIHNQNIIHRDIKPANIIVREQKGFPHGELVLIDFGTARRSTITYLEKVAGDRQMTRIMSAGYAAPEQCLGKYTFQSDLYGVGQTIMHLLSGIHPCDQKYENLDWKTLIPQASLRRLLLHLTQPQPEKRIKSAASLLNEVSRIINLIDSHPLQAWFSLHKRHVMKGAVIACGLTFLLPISIKTGASLLPSVQLNEAAFAAYELGQYRSAFWLYSMVRDKNDPDYHALAAYGMARSQEDLNNHNIAITYYKEAIALGKDQSKVTCRATADLGHLFLMRGDQNNALNYLNQALNCTDEAKTKAAIQRHLAAIHHDAGHRQAAQSYLSNAFEIDDSHTIGLCLQQLFDEVHGKTAVPKSPAVDCLFFE
ncbi:serine/threonine protein kinase [[Leptolyngbya] sp. PCC 7376]|uniref:serine/threonine-protein kinase n=1 Tax=[Leptolyngbya] sp. PCC 7376 TaxID=111781 RepID=UPI00029F2C4E|nr:serine/threonine-protein kinase [[Leptolyngbya] sp. PCC 7376]AFY37870.1 serine/threonine protein kinase [[Leptolyngbya] sp. PCC 7376]